MYRVLLLIGGSLLFVLYVLISGFCILEAIKSFFNKNKLNSSFMSQAGQVKKRSSEAGDVDEGTVYVKNLGTSRVRPQNGLGGPRRVEYSASVASKDKLEKPELDASELDRMKQRRERLKKANEERKAAIALNRQMRMDRFTKGKP